MKRVHLAPCFVAVGLTFLGIADGQQADPPPEIMERFRRLDENNDGALSRQEIGASVPFQEIDADGDGGLTLKEIQAYFSKFQAARAAPSIAETDLSRPIKPIVARIADRAFPSVFMAWSPATNLEGEHRLHNIARHDLVFHGPSAAGLKWNRYPTGLADGFRRESIVAGMRYRATLNALNPNLILLAEIRYRDATQGYLPDDHAWWKRDENGQRIVGWEEGPAYLLDFSARSLIEQVARQAKATIESGVFDGIMLDWWRDDEDRIALLSHVREAIGPDALILVNANDRQTPDSAPFVNGYFMEGWRSASREDWDRLAATLRFAERRLRKPRVNCIETWYGESRQDLNRMRATTCLALTQSDGYCLFSDPNDLPSPDHRHDWYPFWDVPLGKAVSAAGVVEKDGSAMREFEGGTAVYNPMGNPSKVVRFAEPRRSVATGRMAKEHQVAPLDGDIFLKRHASAPNTNTGTPTDPSPSPINRQGNSGR